MEILVERLDAKLREWRPDIAELVKRRIAEIIDLADQDVLDILRSRTVEQEVLDLLDESSTQCSLLRIRTIYVNSKILR